MWLFYIWYHESSLWKQGVYWWKQNQITFQALGIAPSLWVAKFKTHGTWLKSFSPGSYQERDWETHTSVFCTYIHVFNRTEGVSLNWTKWELSIHPCTEDLDKRGMLWNSKLNTWLSPHCDSWVKNEFKILSTLSHQPSSVPFLTIIPS